MKKGVEEDDGLFGRVFSLPSFGTFLVLSVAVSLFSMVLFYVDAYVSLLYRESLVFFSLAGVACLSASLAHHPDPEFASLSKSFLIFGAFYILAEVFSTVFPFLGIDNVVVVVYASSFLWLAGYIPLIRSSLRTVVRYGEYFEMRSLLSSFFVFMAFCVFLMSALSVAVFSSSSLATLPRKLIGLAYPYFDFLLLYIVLLLFFVYRGGRLASYWEAVSAGMLFFTISDLGSVFSLVAHSVFLVNAFSSLYAVAYLLILYGLWDVSLTRRRFLSVSEPETRYRVKMVFLIHNSGVLVCHVGEESMIDKDILGGMLSAVQSFISDSFGSSSDEQGVGEGLRQLQYGVLEIHIEHGKNVFLAVVIAGSGTRVLHEKMRGVLGYIEHTWGHILENWDGSLDALRGVEGYLRGVFGL